MKKNVFLVTWYKSENYGTCLQAYATCQVLDNFANVVLLDKRIYYPIVQIRYLSKKLFVKMVGILKNNTNSFSTYNEGHSCKLKKIDQFVRSIYTTKSITSKKDIIDINKWADCYLVGSDQMWNPWMLSPAYLLDFVPKKSAKPKYSYATSFGVDNIPKEKETLYKKYLPLFSKITVREPRAAELVYSLTGIMPEVVLDPTFLLTQEEWRNYAKQSEICKNYNLEANYILCYFIGTPEFDHLDTVKKIAYDINTEIVLIPTKEADYNLCDDKVVVVANAGAYDFISLINHAKLVCTDSFHAVAFSFMMGTAFYDFPRFKKGDKYSQEARLQNIMEKFGLTNSFWKEPMEKKDIINHLKCQYDNGYSILQEERKVCIKNLQSMIMSSEENHE